MGSKCPACKAYVVSFVGLRVPVPIECKGIWWEESAIEGVKWGDRVSNVVTLMLDEDRVSPLVGRRM
jgi:hypothetical protein